MLIDYGWLMVLVHMCDSYLPTKKKMQQHLKKMKPSTPGTEAMDTSSIKKGSKIDITSKYAGYLGYTVKCNQSMS